MSKVFHRLSQPKPRFSRTLPRVLFACATGLVLFVFIAGGLNLRSSAQGTDSRESLFRTKADKFLHSLRRAVDQDRKAGLSAKVRNEASEVDRLSRIARIRQSKNDIRINVAVSLTNNSEAELKAAGFQIQSRVGDIATLDLDVDRLPDLAALNSVRKISASVVRRPVNDRARQSTGVEDLSGQRLVAQTGRGVVVGIIDTGIDFRHLDFTVPGSGGQQTRIKAMLDMTEYGAQSPDPGWNYTLPGQSAVIGHLYTEADINSALQSAKPANQSSDIVKQRDKNGHGTHVAGTAAGNGIASPTTGTYAGMAPDADLIIVKASRQNDGHDDFDTTDIINGLEFVRQKAAELGKPFVINLSLGSQIGPHDGTTPDERAIDNLVNGGPGRVVCVAAGNERDKSIHARSTVPAGGSQTLDFNVNGSASIIDLYQNNSDRFRVTVTSPDGIALGPVVYDANGFGSPSGQASNQYIEVFNANDDKGDADPANDQPDIVVLFKPSAPDGMWKITLTDADGNPNQSYDAWAEGEGVYFSTFLDHDSHLVSSPGTARGAITVGAIVTRSASQTIGEAAYFTSPGPTADGRKKPDIAAPGYYLYSSRSSDVVDSNFGIIGTGLNAPTDNVHYAGLGGTSMATPVATGGVALFLESNPSLTSAQIKDSVEHTAPQLSFYSLEDWDPLIGFGKLNIAAAIQLGGRPVYSISGRVNQTVGTVQLNLSGSKTAQTNVDSNGNYRFRNLPAGGTYTITPAVNGIYQYSFSPASYTFTNLSANQTADFTASLSSYSISGRVTDPSGNGVSGVRVSPNFGSSSFVLTDSSGNYVLAGLAAGQSYDVVVSAIGYILDPNHLFIGTLTQNATANFTAKRLFNVDGRVTDETGNGISGASVSASGPFTSPATTDANGNYHMTSLLQGTDYPVTIYANGYVFNPNGTVLMNVNGDQRLDFAGHRATTTYAIYGFVRDAGGQNLEGVRVTLRGSLNGTRLTNANGLYRFDMNDAGGAYTVTPSLSGVTFTPASQTITLTADAGFDFVSSTGNQIDNQRFFVSQNYRDFLNREPDTSGLDYWLGGILSCGPLEACIDAQRVNVSAAFFLSIEFQETGYLVERMYKASFGDFDGTSTLGGNPHQLKVPIVKFNEFLADSQKISKDVVVGPGNWQLQLENNKVAFTQEFVTRTRFVNAYPTSLTPAAFVDGLFTKAGVTPSDAERASIINEFGAAGTSADTNARARVLRRVAENTLLAEIEKSKAFVLMQYFGYLRRDPNATPDTDHTGYDYWLGKLNEFNGNFERAEMVKAFLSSTEYRKRFGQ